MTQARERLAMEVLARFGEVRLRLTGTSMLPSMWPGDVVTIRRCAMRDVATGQIVLVTRAEGLLVHRVVACRSPRVLTQGDALSTPDPPAHQRQLLGRIVSIVRHDKRIDPPALTGTRRIVAAILRRSTAAARLLAATHRLRRLVFTP